MTDFIIIFNTIGRGIQGRRLGNWKLLIKVFNFQSLNENKQKQSKKAFDWLIGLIDCSLNITDAVKSFNQAIKRSIFFLVRNYFFT